MYVNRVVTLDEVTTLGSEAFERAVHPPNKKDAYRVYKVCPIRLHPIPYTLYAQLPGSKSVHMPAQLGTGIGTERHKLHQQSNPIP